LAGERILIVDDDESIRQVVSIFLADEGYQVAGVGNGQAALDLVPQFQPDIIILDLRMPIMDGWEFARRYREQPGWHAPIIAFVAALRAEEEQAEIGAVGLLAKPFDLDDLLAVVDRARPARGNLPAQAKT
jgi:two-component system chemotaxis response regulator CheY